MASFTFVSDSSDVGCTLLDREVSSIGGASSSERTESLFGEGEPT